MSSPTGEASLMADAAKTENTLATYRTFREAKLDDAANVVGAYVDIGERDSRGSFTGLNQYKDGSWQLQFKGSGNGKTLLGGNVAARFQLTNDYWDSYFIAGAEVTLKSSGTETSAALAGPISDNTDMRVFYDTGFYGYIGLNNSKYYRRNTVDPGHFYSFKEKNINTNNTTAWSTYYMQ